MSRAPLSAALRAAVRERAGGCCEYCRMPEGGTFFPHEPDHIVAAQHGGMTALENLALACTQCNRTKGPNIASVDPETGQVVALFNPRTDSWSDHFVFESGEIIPVTPVGRATALLLNLNAKDRVETRFKIAMAGRFSL